jgi:hypothetical protein
LKTKRQDSRKVGMNRQTHASERILRQIGSNHSCCRC